MGDTNLAFVLGSVVGGCVMALIQAWSFRTQIRARRAIDARRLAILAAAQGALELARIGESWPDDVLMVIREELTHTDADES